MKIKNQYKIYNEDCFEILKNINDNSIPVGIYWDGFMKDSLKLFYKNIL
jgi:DNA modification methylase